MSYPYSLPGKSKYKTIDAILDSHDELSSSMKTAIKTPFLHYSNTDLISRALECQKWKSLEIMCRDYQPELATELRDSLYWSKVLDEIFNHQQHDLMELILDKYPKAGSYNVLREKWGPMLEWNFQAYPHLQDPEGQKKLFYRAVKNKDTRSLEILLRYVKKQEYPQLILDSVCIFDLMEIAFKTGYWEILEVLCRNAAKSDRYRDKCSLFLEAAVTHKQYSLIKVILDTYPELHHLHENATKENLLYRAVRNNDVKALEILLANVKNREKILTILYSKVNAFGKTLLVVALELNHLDCFDLLLKSYKDSKNLDLAATTIFWVLKSNIQKKNWVYVEKALQLASQVSSLEPEVLELFAFAFRSAMGEETFDLAKKILKSSILKEYPEELNYTCYDSFHFDSLMHMLVRNRENGPETEILEELLKNGINVLTPDSKGETAIELALSLNRWSNLKIICKHADVTKFTQEEKIELEELWFKVLLKALRYKEYDVVNVILNKYPELLYRKQARNKENLFHVAVRNNDTTGLEKLLLLSFNFERKDELQSVFPIAIELGYWNCFNLLRENIGNVAAVDSIRTYLTSLKFQPSQRMLDALMQASTFLGVDEATIITDALQALKAKSKKNSFLDSVVEKGKSFLGSKEKTIPTAPSDDQQDSGIFQQEKVSPNQQQVKAYEVIYTPDTEVASGLYPSLQLPFNIPPSAPLPPVPYEILSEESQATYGVLDFQQASNLYSVNYWYFAQDGQHYQVDRDSAAWVYQQGGRIYAYEVQQQKYLTTSEIQQNLNSIVTSSLPIDPPSYEEASAFSTRRFNAWETTQLESNLYPVLPQVSGNPYSLFGENEVPIPNASLAPTIANDIKFQQELISSPIPHQASEKQKPEVIQAPASSLITQATINLKEKVDKAGTELKKVFSLFFPEVPKHEPQLGERPNKSQSSSKSKNLVTAS